MSAVENVNNSQTLTLPLFAIGYGQSNAVLATSTSTESLPGTGSGPVASPPFHLVHIATTLSLLIAMAGWFHGGCGVITVSTPSASFVWRTPLIRFLQRQISLPSSIYLIDHQKAIPPFLASTTSSALIKPLNYGSGSVVRIVKTGTAGQPSVSSAIRPGQRIQMA